jgi:hypothetical protein
MKMMQRHDDADGRGDHADGRGVGGGFAVEWEREI